MRGSVWLGLAAAALVIAGAVVLGLRDAEPPGKPASSAGVASQPRSGLAQPAPPAQPGTTPSRTAAGPAPSFDIVRIEPGGQAVIAGRAAPGDRVRVLDRDQMIGEATADAHGEWVLLPARPVPPGSRALHLEAVGAADGRTRRSDDIVALAVPPPPSAKQPGALAALLPNNTSQPPRIPQPPAEPFAADTLAAAHGGTYLVQRGNSLWLIARHLYGEGVRYTAIYRANRDQIQDPDRIYPGQKFKLPKS